MGYMDAIQLPGISAAGTGGAAAAFNPATAIGGLGLEAASAWYGNRQAQKRQRESFDQQKWMMQNRYQMQTKDMMAAGLNPMLATTQGAPMPNAPAAAKTDKPELMQAVANSQLASAQAANIRQQTENLKLESENIKNTAAGWPTMMAKLSAEISWLEQQKASGKASEEDLKQLKELHAIQTKLGGQEWDTKRPEQVASGLDAAQYSAMASRVLKPLLEILNQGAKFKP